MSQPEARLQRSIVRKLREAGYPFWRIRPLGLRAWPDLYGIEPGTGRAIHIEAKMPGEKPTIHQALRLDRLRKAGAITGWATSFEECMSIIEEQPCQEKPSSSG